MKSAILVVALVALSVAGCGGGPTAPAIPDCQAHNTATLVLTNNALVSRDAYIDGAFVGTLGSSGGSLTREVAAGVAHRIEMRGPITGTIYSSANPILIQCSTYPLTNTF